MHRITDRPDMTSAVYRGRKASTQTKHYTKETSTNPASPFFPMTITFPIVIHTRVLPQDIAPPTNFTVTVKGETSGVAPSGPDNPPRHVTPKKSIFPKIRYETRPPLRLRRCLYIKRTLNQHRVLFWVVLWRFYQDRRGLYLKQIPEA